ncbi:hypothetical protein HGM15179_021238, partial [Zosterops borbonicus]
IASKFPNVRAWDRSLSILLVDWDSLVEDAADLLDDYEGMVTTKATTEATSEDTDEETDMETGEATTTAQAGDLEEVDLMVAAHYARVEAANKVMKEAMEATSQLDYIKAALKEIQEPSTDVPEALVAAVAKFELLWEASARLTTDHLLLLEALVDVVATLGELAATMARPDKDVLWAVSPKALGAALRRSTWHLCCTLNHHGVTPLGQHSVTSPCCCYATLLCLCGVTSLGQSVAALEANLGAIQALVHCGHQEGTEGSNALGLLGRLVAACDRATTLPQWVQHQLRDIEVTLRWTREVTPDVLEALVATVAKTDQLWEASAHLTTCPPAVLHSLRYLNMVVSEPSLGIPQYMEMGFVDGIPITRYDSERGRVEPLTQWMKDGAELEYWDRNTQINVGNQHVCAVDLETARDRYNQSR